MPYLSFDILDVVPVLQQVLQRHGRLDDQSQYRYEREHDHL